MTKKKSSQQPAQAQALNQLTLWFEPEDDHSFLVDFYDLAPKFVYGKKQYGEGGTLQPLERTFTLDGVKYRTFLVPTKVKARKGKNKGKYVDCFPGKRERIVEDVLRKFAADGKTYKEGGQVGVIFTLYELREELKRTGHSFSFYEVIDSLFILCRSSLELYKINGPKTEQLYADTLFSRMSAATEEEWEGTGRKTGFVVFFHSIVKTAIFELTHRRYHYEKCIRYKQEIAVYLHKRLSLRWLQASIIKPYEIRLSQIVEGCGLSDIMVLKDHHQKARKALDELIESKVLLKWEYTLKYGDYLYKLIPHIEFVHEMKRSNQLYQQMRKELG